MTRSAQAALPQLSPAHALMNVTIGYWASQAGYVAAKLGSPTSWEIPASTPPIWPGSPTATR